MDLSPKLQRVIELSNLHKELNLKLVEITAELNELVPGGPALLAPARTKEVKAAKALPAPRVPKRSQSLPKPRDAAPPPVDKSKGGLPKGTILPGSLAEQIVRLFEAGKPREWSPDETADKLGRDNKSFVITNELGSLARRGHIARPRRGRYARLGFQSEQSAPPSPRAAAPSPTTEARTPTAAVKALREAPADTSRKEPRGRNASNVDDVVSLVKRMGQFTYAEALRELSGSRAHIHGLLTKAHMGGDVSRHVTPAGQVYTQPGGIPTFAARRENALQKKGARDRDQRLIQLVNLMAKHDGLSIDQLGEHTGWDKNTLSGVLSRARTMGRIAASSEHPIVYRLTGAGVVLNDNRIDLSATAKAMRVRVLRFFARDTVPTRSLAEIGDTLNENAVAMQQLLKAMEQLGDVVAVKGGFRLSGTGLELLEQMGALGPELLAILQQHKRPLSTGTLTVLSGASVSQVERALADLQREDQITSPSEGTYTTEAA